MQVKNASEQHLIPKDFIWRRLHSLAGIWLTGYLFFHLFTNSQAALWLGDDGKSFIKSVNSIHEIPYLVVVEILILGVPILIHMIWGIKYALKAKINSINLGTGNEVVLPYSRNRAYTWQRITSWLLIVGIMAHVLHMRFIDRPLIAPQGLETSYMVRLKQDPGLRTVAERLNVNLYDRAQILALVQKEQAIETKDPVALQKAKQEAYWLATLRREPLRDGEIMAVAGNFGTAELLMLRETFKMPMMLVLYTLFVMAAVYHGFNGLWTFLIKWGVTLTERSQRMMLHVSTALMILTGFFGLSTIWLTYWVNLKE